jgi:hypothetical protein
MRFSMNHAYKLQVKIKIVWHFQNFRIWEPWIQRFGLGNRVNNLSLLPDFGRVRPKFTEFWTNPRHLHSTPLESSRLAVRESERQRSEESHHSPRFQVSKPVFLW